ncbi:putative 37S ribosomal protein Rsm24 [Penicillium brasilianum]|uniref:Putative 37S ribosomal protein Rsm24 n=1 Tax=Penicillium brasilianum TaxID=104259 RepID=A0A1S9RPB5_PENBI|nr:putative 37S ribosomal protein Rsm24 [Penicillium brasilianum]
MACVARSLTRSARVLAHRGPGFVPTRSFSVSPFRFVTEDPVIPPPPKDLKAEDYPPVPDYSPDLLTKEERSMYDMLSPEERAAFDAENQRLVADFNNLEKRAAAFAEIQKSVDQIDKQEDIRFEDVRGKVRGFWAEDDGDEMAQVEDGDEDIQDDEITSMAHAEMELHREMREYARIAAWDMPMLSKLAKPFTLPPQTHILRFRYTTYMGEQHPAEPKVVVELASRDLTPKYLTEAQRQTFLKLVGPRYNPQTDVVKMSAEQFGSRAQNKRYLADVVNTLIQEAKKGDAFADIPLDLRHHKPKFRPQFPESWNMTNERRQQLAARRKERLTAQSSREAIVDGNQVVSEAVLALPELNPALKARAAEEREKVAVKVGARQPKRPVRR